MANSLGKRPIFPENIFRQNTWSYGYGFEEYNKPRLGDSSNKVPGYNGGTLPFTVGAYVLENTGKKQGLLKRNIYSANLLKKTKLLVERAKNERCTFESEEVLRDHQNKVVVCMNRHDDTQRKASIDDGELYNIVSMTKETTKPHGEQTLNDQMYNLSHTASNSRLDTKTIGSSFSLQSPKVDKSMHNVTSRSPLTRKCTKKKQKSRKSRKKVYNCDNEVREHFSRKEKADERLYNGNIETCLERKIKQKTTKNFTKRMKNLLSVSPFKRCKILYSERQSQNLNGIPRVPPCSPDTYDFEYVACLADIKSQREFKTKLQKLGYKQAEEQKIILKTFSQKEKERKLKERNILMKKQRQIIYALNKAMTDLEGENFKTFKDRQFGAPV